MLFFQLYLITFLVFFLIDLLWLGVIAKDLYKKHLGFLMAKKVNWAAAMIFYLLFIGGLVFFVLMPAVDKGQWHYAILVGGLFGFIAYATYDLTNLATLENWPIKITIIDLIWGTTLGALTSLIAYLIYQGIWM